MGKGEGLKKLEVLEVIGRIMVVKGTSVKLKGSNGRIKGGHNACRVIESASGLFA
jgi:hypothetical protein